MSIFDQYGLTEVLEDMAQPSERVYEYETVPEDLRNRFREIFARALFDGRCAFEFRERCLQGIFLLNEASYDEQLSDAVDDALSTHDPNALMLQVENGCDGDPQQWDEFWRTVLVPLMQLARTRELRRTKANSRGRQI